ncbi:MAG: hypothetical protein GTO14_16315 [Anaerolineales bacterium]|nr:hypothetical protein [Anaerolineales bacterium]
MTGYSTKNTEPSSTPGTTPSNRLFLLTLLIGVLMGMVIMCLVGYGLYFFGYVTLVDETTAQPVVQVTEVRIPVCPTCVPTPADAKILVVTPTTTPTATPNFAATATAACESFNQQFPGTPCPATPSP